MTNIWKDPVSEKFLEDESLELCERVGLAIRECAKITNIWYNKQQLAQAGGRAPLSFAGFNFASGMSFDMGNAKRCIESYPDQATEIQAMADRLRVYNHEHNNVTTTTERPLDHAGAMWGGGWGGHSNPDYGRIIDMGTDGIREIIAEGRKNHPESAAFYNGCEATLEAIDILGRRAGELAAELAAKEEDPVNKHRFELAAKAFEVVPKKPAYDFTSAVQVFWLIFTFDGIDSPGRLDQFMARSYEQSKDRAEVLDVLERLWESFHQTRTWNLCISGSDENWNDMSNGLTYDILDMVKKTKYNTPNLTMRVHRNTPEKLWKSAAEALATGTGLPCIYNDEVVCPAFEAVGIPPEHSHLYCMNGCNQIDIMGKSHMGLEDGEVIFAKCLEFALHNGKNAMSDDTDSDILSLQTGDARKFKTYEELEVAYLRQLDYVTMNATMNANLAQQTRAMYSPNPLRSCLMDGCLEKGVDYRNGGPLYNHGQILAEGIADTGDSLYAIKKLVFEDGKYTMEQLIDALDANFEGYEDLYHDFSTCAKFGNDIEAVDEITAKSINHFFKTLKRIHTYRGGVYMGGCSTFNRGAGYGRKIAALPNGKRKGAPMLADSIGAVPGCDVKGPTALLKSALRYNHLDSGSGFLLQVKFDKKLFNTEKGMNSFINLAKAYFAGGGQNFTVNVVSQEELLDAKKNPNAHRDLIVRVGGYSDYFVNLEEGLQDNIIARSSLEL